MMAPEQAFSSEARTNDLRKLRGKQLVIKPGRTRRYHVPGDAARIITALLTVRDKVIAPSSRESAHRDAAGHPSIGPRSTATTKPYASTCRACSTTSASHSSRRPHRQHLVDRIPAIL